MVFGKRPNAHVALLLTFLLSIAAFVVVELFRGQLYRVYSTGVYLNIHIVAEVLSVAISVSIFGLGWFTYGRSKNVYILFLGIAFLGVGIFDLLHLMSFPGMPSLFTPSSTNKNLHFWIPARLLAATSFLVSAFIVQKQPKQAAQEFSKWLMLGSVLGLTLATYVWVNAFPDALLEFFRPAVGLTPLKVGMEYLVIAITIAAFVFYYRRYQKTQETFLVWFMCALIVSMFSELAFTVYKSSLDTFSLLGHVYKVVAFILIYRGVFVTAVRTAFDELAQSEEKFATAFMNAPSMMVITKRDSGEIVEVNRAFCEFYGASREALLGSSIPKIKLWAKMQQRSDILRQLEETGRAHSLEATFRIRSGEIRHVICSLDFIAVSGEEYIVNVANDISERKHAEEALLASEQHIKELSDMRAQFIQIIVHQLRTPLGSIRWNLESLLDGSQGPLKSVQKQLLAVTYDADVQVISRLNDLVTTLDIEEERVGFNKTSVSLYGLLKSVSVDMQRRCRAKHITYDLKPFKGELPLLALDPQKTRTILEKLTENAAMYTPKGGKITVSLQYIGDHVRFEVHDTGVGIPETERTHIFDSFYRASNAYLVDPNASGVGLAIAKCFVERQGGKIGFTSKEGKGSTFWFTLPLENRAG